jgi:hypothetical protein
VVKDTYGVRRYIDVVGSIRLCRDDERPAILELVNVATAAAYRGVIPDDRWRVTIPERQIERSVVLADPPFGS